MEHPSLGESDRQRLIAAAAGISNLYSPAQDRTFSNTRNDWETQIVIDALGFEAKEFWPDIRRKIFRKE